MNNSRTGGATRPIRYAHGSGQGSTRPSTPQADTKNDCSILSPEDFQPGYILYLDKRKERNRARIAQAGLEDGELGHPVLVMGITGRSVLYYPVSVGSLL